MSGVWGKTGHSFQPDTINQTVTEIGEHTAEGSVKYGWRLLRRAEYRAHIQQGWSCTIKPYGLLSGIDEDNAEATCCY